MCGEWRVCAACSWRGCAVGQHICLISKRSRVRVPPPLPAHGDRRVGMLDRPREISPFPSRKAQQKRGRVGGWPSGLWRRFAKPLIAQAVRRFESCASRHCPVAPERFGVIRGANQNDTHLDTLPRAGSVWLQPKWDTDSVPPSSNGRETVS